MIHEINFYFVLKHNIFGAKDFYCGNQKVTKKAISSARLALCPLPLPLLFQQMDPGIWKLYLRGNRTSACPHFFSSCPGWFLLIFYSFSFGLNPFIAFLKSIQICASFLISMSNILICQNKHIRRKFYFVVTVFLCVLTLRDIIKCIVQVLKL